MKIEFISHAGFIIETKNRKILVDPWTKSKVFNDGWTLWSKAANVDYKEIDYIWVSHEHPDHFNIPTLKSIDENERKRIKILYQEHASPRLKEAFKKLGFPEVIELPIYEWKKIDEIDLFCGSVGSMDSFLVIRSDNHTILNLNDCILKEKQYRYIKRRIGKIDFLFTQFSFANWVGNEKDETGACNKKISDIYLQRKILNPQYIIPFASFVYFCSKENSRMNEWINTPEKIIQLDIPEINFMYPGDKINSSNIDFKSKKAVENYMNDIVNIELPPPHHKYRGNNASYR